MEYTEIKTFVRSQADTDEVDAPDIRLDVYARAAYNDIRRRITQWVDQSTSATISTVANTEGYTLPTGIEYVTQVVGPTDNLGFVSWSNYLEALDGEDISYSTAEADYFTVRNGTIYLLPTPSTSGVSYTVYGYGTFADWPAGAVESPLPREFDEPICWFMLSKFYLGQEDLELAQMYMADYETAVNRFIANAMRQESVYPKVLGGAKTTRLSYPSWVARMTEG